MEHKITEETIFAVLKTLKELDVRGFDSMNRLVGLVMLFENILKQPPENKEESE